MNSFEIIKTVRLTEKGTRQGEKYNQYTVVADRRANKTQIRQAVQDLFKVKVTKVNTLNLDELAAELQIGALTLKDIVAQFLRPGRDPREDLPLPVFTTFMSTSAFESSSYARSSIGSPPTRPTLIAAT